MFVPSFERKIIEETMDMLPEIEEQKLNIESLKVAPKKLKRWRGRVEWKPGSTKGIHVDGVFYPISIPGHQSTGKATLRQQLKRILKPIAIVSLIALFLVRVFVFG